MNNYPEWWDKTVTVYNKYENPTDHKTYWYPHTLTGCFWKDTDTILTGTANIVNTNATLCRVRVNKKFLEKYLWDELPEIQKHQYFTFCAGDILILGNVNDAVDEYTSGKRSTDLLTKYKKLQGCFVVNKCSINTGAGRGNEHYYVRGV